MSPMKCLAAAFAASAALYAPSAEAQTANGSPTTPAPPGLVGTPRPVSRTAPSVGTGAVATPGLALPPASKAPKLTAAQKAEQRQLEHDLRICIGC